MIEPFWWIRSAGVAAVPVSNREPQVSRRDRPTRAAFFYFILKIRPTELSTASLNTNATTKVVKNTASA